MEDKVDTYKKPPIEWSIGPLFVVVLEFNIPSDADIRVCAVFFDKDKATEYVDKANLEINKIYSIIPETPLGMFYTKEELEYWLKEIKDREDLLAKDFKSLKEVLGEVKLAQNLRFYIHEVKKLS